MVDFKKLTRRKKISGVTDPIEIFEDLDKESGKEYLRPSQESVLRAWHSHFRGRRDTIIKLHTGQGKTLIGLLMLQSSLNENQGPAVYICPNNYLVQQTVEEARSFGIRTVQFDPEVPGKIPQLFLNSARILVTTCSKLFNGKSVFGGPGTGREPIKLGAIVIDDAHKCLDIIREAFSVRVGRKNEDETPNPVYKDLWRLFEDSLRRQAPGTCADIASGEDRVMAVPFWTWHDKQREVLKILEKHKAREELLFVWDMIKDNISQSVCVFSGRSVETSPRLLPLDLISSFSEAPRRILLSATLTEDAFLVRDLGISPESVSAPLSQGDVRYSGERLIILPTLVSPRLERERIAPWVSSIAKKHGTFGTVTITPSFSQGDLWNKYGANVADVKTLYKSIDHLRKRIDEGNAREVLVLVNEYDGVDLPDNMCRILCLDSLPAYKSLMERYLQDLRPTSTGMRRQMAQRVEQGMGRGIRGSSDWCIVLITGNNLTDFLSEDSKRRYLSKEAQQQVRIGEELAKEMQGEGTGLAVIEKLVNQCLERDADWKEYYKEKMSEVEPEKYGGHDLEISLIEREAETLFRQGHYEKAVLSLEKLISKSDQADRGWYLQLKAVYKYPLNAARSMEIQLKAHSENLRVFHPEPGITYTKLRFTGASQANEILQLVKKHDTANALVVDVMKTLDKLSFNSPADSFEEGLDELGKALGFTTQRPELEGSGGPDNLWRVNDKMYWVIECKNEVLGKREEISKGEIGQVNNDIGWFEKHYTGCQAAYVFVHPAEKLAKDAYPNKPCWTINEASLDELKENVKKLYLGLGETLPNTMSEDLVKKRLLENQLLSDELAKRYLRGPARQSKA